MQGTRENVGRSHPERASGHFNEQEREDEFRVLAFLMILHLRSRTQVSDLRAPGLV